MDEVGLFGISIHAPREGSDLALVVETAVGGGISIHAPREGSDLVGKRWTNNSPISIHAPREGSDSSGTRHATPAGYFYPRSP